MQVSIEPLEGLQRKMIVQIPADRISTAIDEKLKQLSKTIKLDGFRPGKVPSSVVKQKFGGQVRQEVIGDAIDASFRDALIQENIRPAGMPEIQPIDGDDKEGISYSAVFEVYPEIESIELDSVQVERPVVEIKEADILNVLEKLREQRKEWVEVERAAQEGDQVMTDFEGKIDDTVFEGGSGENMAVEIGAGRMLKEFEDGLLGLNKGEEKIVTVNFPDDYHGKEVAGKRAQFTLKANSISESKLPEFDTETVKSFGVESGDLEELKKDVNKNMEKELAQKIKMVVKNNVMDGLLDKNDVTVPRALLDDEIQNLKKQMAQNMAQNMGQDPSTLDLANFPDDLYRDEASKRVKLGLLVGELLKKASIELDRTRFEKTLQGMASSYEKPQQVIDYYTKNNEARSSLENMVLEDQVVDHILDRAKVSEVSTDFDELMNEQAK